MIENGRRDAERVPALVPARPGGPVLVHAVSGLGKSTLAATHPSRVLDADTFLYDAVALGFPDLEPRARLRAWRDLCRRRPWVGGGADLDRWAGVRRAFVEPVVAAMAGGTHPLVVTSLLDPPWLVSAYYGVVRGQYMEHLRLVGREPDNRQSEAMNDRLEGYPPLVRVPSGTFLGERPEILTLIRERDEEAGGV
ncbi:MAG: hypothetical protein H6732_01715 [Alphaproteobacteria bacterium]|nr:hypothetical protein [Alphaproteobacteria bacterium]